ncbi:DUF6879 family protein [Sphaerisporangium sp. NPDC051017]|uniref:DUF6879 family protein n=1 Tax=Sphaerisporangium sp. NPDC051017 TaxID=3154636 RepID=UPI0034358EDF
MGELFAKTQRLVTHLELRDTYGTSHPDFQDWAAGVPVQEIVRRGRLDPWNDLVRSHVDRGVIFRRARIISTPPSDYIRFEHAITPYSNLVGGELVRWLDRSRARDIAVSPCDFWQFDDHLVCWVYQTGDGEKAGHELSDDPREVKLCSAAFEAVWDRAIDHEKFALPA